MRHLFLSGVLGMAVGLACADVRADGMVIPRTAYAIPHIPNQRALIQYANGTETLVIETSFAGPGTNFAWVVPLPATPHIEPISTGLFPTLQTIFEPEVVLSIHHYWLALPIVVLMVLLVKWARRESFFAVLVAGILMFMAIGLLPALAPARSRGFSPGQQARVRVLSQENAGLFDTVTLQAADPRALMRWLSSNGFSTPTNIEAVVADYIREGWVFAAARLSSEASETGSKATHPLAFTFKTDKPVYPLRLTGAATRSCAIDLYVFGPGRAAARWFSVQRCGKPRYDDPRPARPRLRPDRLQIRNQELRGLTALAPVATKLSGVLSSSMMANDAYLSWNTYFPSVTKRYSTNAALVLCANVAAAVFTGLVGVWWLASIIGGVRATRARRSGPWLAPVSLAVGLVSFLALPRISNADIKLERASIGEVNWRTYQLSQFIENAMDTDLAKYNSTPPLTKMDCENLLHKILQKYQQRYERTAPDMLDVLRPATNYFTGQLVRFEASPGNVVIRPAVHGRVICDNRVAGTASYSYDLVWYDFEGSESITNSVVPGGNNN